MIKSCNSVNSTATERGLFSIEFTKERQHFVPGILDVVAVDIGECGHLIVQPCASIPCQREGVFLAQVVKPPQFLWVMVNRYDKAPTIGL